MTSSQKTITVHTIDGPVRVRCYPSGVPGLVVHPALGLEDDPHPLWVLAHEPAGHAITTSILFLGRGEAEGVAALLGPLADWTRELDPLPDAEAVHEAFARGTAWREGTSEAYRSLINVIGDEMIRRKLSRRCGGGWHRVAFGWGQTLVRLGTRLGKPKGATVLRFSAKATEEAARTVWNYEARRFACLDCGTEV